MDAILFLLNVGHDIHRLGLVRQIKLLEGDRGPDATWRRPGVEGDVG